MFLPADRPNTIMERAKSIGRMPRKAAEFRPKGDGLQTWQDKIAKSPCWWMARRAALPIVAT
jgi:hypothetical protein